MSKASFDALRKHLEQAPPLRISEPGTIEAAVAIVLVAAGESRLEVLLIKRAENERDPWSGQMALPGGRRDPQDTGLLETARREAVEETGIDLPVDCLLGELDDLHPRTPVLPPIVVRPFVFGLSDRPLVSSNPEVTLHIWAGLSELRDGMSTSRVSARGHVLEVPSYVIGEHVVWGMTERILKPIIGLCA